LKGLVAAQQADNAPEKVSFARTQRSSVFYTPGNLSAASGVGEDAGASLTQSYQDLLTYFATHTAFSEAQVTLTNDDLEERQVHSKTYAAVITKSQTVWNDQGEQQAEARVLKADDVITMREYAQFAANTALAAVAQQPNNRFFRPNWFGFSDKPVTSYVSLNGHAAQVTVTPAHNEVSGSDTTRVAGSVRFSMSSSGK